MKDKTNVLNTYTDYAWKTAYLIGGRVCNPRQAWLHSPCTMIQPALAKSET